MKKKKCPLLTIRSTRIPVSEVVDGAVTVEEVVLEVVAETEEDVGPGTLVAAVDSELPLVSSVNKPDTLLVNVPMRKLAVVVDGVAEVHAEGVVVDLVTGTRPVAETIVSSVSSPVIFLGTALAAVEITVPNVSSPDTCLGSAQLVVVAVDPPLATIVNRLVTSLVIVPRVAEDVEAVAVVVVVDLAVAEVVDEDAGVVDFQILELAVASTVNPLLRTRKSSLTKYLTIL